MTNYAYLSLSIEQSDPALAFMTMYNEVKEALNTGAPGSGEGLPGLGRVEASNRIQAASLLPWHTGYIDVHIHLNRIRDAVVPVGEVTLTTDTVDLPTEQGVVVAHGLDFLLDTSQSSIDADAVFLIILAHWHGREIEMTEKRWKRGLDLEDYTSGTKRSLRNGVWLWLDNKKPRHHYAGWKWHPPSEDPGV